MGLMDSPICERCLEKDEAATHIICGFQTMAKLGFLHLGQYFTEPGDYQNAPLSVILCFFRSVGLLKC
jgi:hypothetical protein